MPQYLIEIATSDYTTTANAVAGGADRIELCANLAEGGTTASYATIKKCREDFDVQLYPIIRPRGGDFLYSEAEFRLIQQDIEMCREIGCDGIVTGLLNADGSIDIERTAQLIDKAFPLKVTFHRAFDRCRDVFEALEQLIGCGCERILTSGQQLTAIEGKVLIAALNSQADGRIIIMPGSGVREANIKELAQYTGCREFHASLRSRLPSAMEYQHPAFAQDAESIYNNYIDPDAVKALRQALQ